MGAYHYGPEVLLIGYRDQTPQNYLAILFYERFFTKKSQTAFVAYSVLLMHDLTVLFVSVLDCYLCDLNRGVHLFRPPIARTPTTTGEEDGERGGRGRRRGEGRRAGGPGSGPKASSRPSGTPGPSASRQIRLGGPACAVLQHALIATSDKWTVLKYRRNSQIIVRDFIYEIAAADGIFSPCQRPVSD
ncbi:hypothetical protein GWI33_014415 [Rhynchophorus ferrugineus]|uniref:Uncharacterized protein n=1 Tax=Rhynchophorus ferrugineus TaxID=354439 RepID=A0A834I7E9_RHYFE|nr:hypothetical protein GWI33_014415 [Rhynchophorus ferrugineus]